MKNMYLNGDIAVQYGFEMTECTNDKTCYKRDNKKWIHQIENLKRSTGMTDDELRQNGYAVETYYTACEELCKKEKNLFDFAFAA